MKVVVFIDGSNLYRRLKDLFDNEKISLLAFDYRKFAEWLVKDNKFWS